MLLEATKERLAAMVKHREQIFANLAPTDQQALFEAFRQLSRYAATMQNNDPKEVLALSQAVFEITIDLPELNKVLSSELLPSSQTKGMSETAAQKAEREAKESAHLDRYGTDIANYIHIFVGADPRQPPESEKKRLGWLDSIVDRFLDRPSSMSVNKVF